MNPDEWREQLKAKRKKVAAERRAKLAADPRVQAMKEALKQRRHAAYEAAKARRKEYAEEKKKREEARAAEERARRDAELRDLVRPATEPERGDR